MSVEDITGITIDYSKLPKNRSSSMQSDEFRQRVMDRLKARREEKCKK